MDTDIAALRRLLIGKWYVEDSDIHKEVYDYQPMMIVDVVTLADSRIGLVIEHGETIRIVGVGMLVGEIIHLTEAAARAEANRRNKVDNNVDDDVTEAA